MKKTKLITSLSTLGMIAVSTPIVATSCSNYGGFIKSVDGSNLWVTQPNDIKVFMPMGKDMKLASNVTWSIKDYKSFSADDIEITNVLPNKNTAPFGFLKITKVPTQAETIIIHAENADKSYCADSEITIKAISADAAYSIKIGDVALTSFMSATTLDKVQAGLKFELLDNDGSAVSDNKWQWQLGSPVIDPSGNIKLAFDSTVKGVSTLRTSFTGTQENNVVAFCSIINSETKAELTRILTIPKPETLQ